MITAAIFGIAFYTTRRNEVKEVPEGIQNYIEALFEILDRFIGGLAPKKFTKIFFPILVTIFIYLLFANWSSLFTPLFNSFGFVYWTEHAGVQASEITVLGDVDRLGYYPNRQLDPGYGGEASYEADEPHEEEAAGDEAHGGEAAHSSEQRVIIIPFFRAPSSDMNLTLALALMSVVATQVFGFWGRGLGYILHFLPFDSFGKKHFGLAIIDMVVGFIELISEVFKIVSFSFRLFGNIFAGEVVLIVILSLTSFGVILLFFGLEIFVGLIQAFVFFILSLVFFSNAAKSHHEHGEEH